MIRPFLISSTLLLSIFAHAQKALPTFTPAELPADQLKTLQGSVSAAKQATQQTIEAPGWKAIERELAPEQWARKQEAYQTQLAAMFQSPPGKENKQEDGPKLVGEQLVLFVSSSMPLHTLRAYARDLAKVGGVMVMRGGIGGLNAIQPTLAQIHRILSVKADCQGMCKMWDTEVLIDPMLFRMYGIKKVPALIYQPNMQIAAYCDGIEQAQKAAGVVYGDASLMAMLDELHKENPDPIIKQLSAQLWKQQ